MQPLPIPVQTAWRVVNDHFDSENYGKGVFSIKLTMSLRGKCVYYCDWERNPAYKEWVWPFKGDKLKALCTACNQSIDIWAALWKKQKNGMCAQRRLRPAWASAQSDQSSLCAQWVAKDPSFLHADSEDWSDWADAQADLSLHWVHMPFCWICHEAAHF